MPDNVDFQLEVRGLDVLDEVEDRIERGIRRTTSSTRPNSLGNKMRRAAQQRIAEEGRVWKGELINSFEVEQNVNPTIVTTIRLVNEASYAAAVDEGAEYGSEGPPLHRLIPWVLTNMQHTRVDDDGNLVSKDG